VKRRTRPKTVVRTKVVGDPSDPKGMARYRDRFLEWMQMQNYTEHTVTFYGRSLNVFIVWAEERSITQPSEVTKPILDRYKRHLFYFRQPSGKPLRFRTQHARLLAVRMYFKWLCRNNFILYNPASELELPRLEQRLPKAVLTTSEVEAVMNQADATTGQGVRDRAMLETLYSTGMRRMELANLEVWDLDREGGAVFIRQGKGQKDRVIPIGERALRWIEKYLEEVRPSLALEPDAGTLFLSQYGEALTPVYLTELIGRYVASAEIGKRGSCHLFRHTMATQMLENGADIRYVQQMLGHAKLESTAVYTQVSIPKLKEIHTATHPSARLGRSVDLGDIEAEREQMELFSSLSSSEHREKKSLH